MSVEVVVEVSPSGCAPQFLFVEVGFVDLVEREKETVSGKKVCHRAIRIHRRSGRDSNSEFNVGRHSLRHQTRHASAQGTKAWRRILYLPVRL
jgi:hypothetical protein